jgi:phenylalanyl-tRNA synthetase beta chain
MGKVRARLSEFLVSRGFYEIVSNSLVHSEKAGGWHDPDREVRILNPISSELDVLRQSLVHSAVPIISHNVKRKESDLQLFEFGKVYEKNGDPYEEEERLGLYMAGRREGENWRNSDVFFSYFDLKGFVQSILERFGLLDRCELRDNEKAHLEEGAAWFLCGDREEELVAFGKLDPEMVEEWDIDRPVLMAEFRLDPLFAAYRDKELVYAPLSKQLPVRKDMAFILDRDVRFETVRRTALEAETKYLQEVDLFDVYEGDKVGEGKKSYALKFMFHDPEKTLKDKEIEKAMKRVSDSLSEKLGAELRDH